MSIEVVKHFFEQVESLPNTILGNIEPATSPLFLPAIVPAIEEVEAYLDHSECHLFSKSAQLINGDRLLSQLEGKDKEALFSAWPLKSASEVDQPLTLSFNADSTDCTLSSKVEQQVGATNDFQALYPSIDQTSNPDNEQTSSANIDQTLNSCDEQASTSDVDQTSDSCRGEQTSGSDTQQKQPSTFEQIVEIYLVCAEHILDLPGTNDQQTVDSRMNGLFRCFEMLHIFNAVNEHHNQLIPHENFYIPELEELVNLQEDLCQYRQCSSSHAQGKLFFFNYPFLMDSTAKSFVLRSELALKQQPAVEEQQRKFLEKFKESYWIQIHLRRSLGIPLIDELVDMLTCDTFCQLADSQRSVALTVTSRNHLFEEAMFQLLFLNPQVLRRPLLITFPSESAGGEGGVRQEFFNSLETQVMDPKFGMFVTETDDTQNEEHLLWFKPSEHPVNFCFLGVLCGLAVYNDAYFGLPFPLAFFKKLLGKPVGLEDLKEVRPTYARSLEEILSYGPEDVENLCYTFVYVHHCDNESRTIALVEQGDKKDVTQENKHEYVELCADLVLNKLVQREFENFSAGFKSIVSEDILKLFRPEELREMMAGTKEFDFESLQEKTWYEKPYNENHPTIQWFWEVVHGMEDSQKRQFMQFLTGRKKCTVTAMRSLKISIIPAKPDAEGNLGMPFSHTCHEILKLPPYDSKDVLKERLLYVINQTETFGSQINAVYEHIV